MKNQFKILCGAVALAMAGQVSAGTTWDFTSSVPSGVTVTAYSNTGGADNSATAANNAALQTIQAATWTIYSPVNGIGISNADSGTGTYNDNNEGTPPEHAIDNEQRYDMALLKFTSSVKLTKLTLGWTQNDSDVTVMAYTGTGDPTVTANGKLVGNTYDQLVGLGWTSIGNYSDLVAGTAKAINAGGTSSSYWLIGAYNPLANPGGGSVTGSSTSYDYVKLASVSDVVSVPEPGSLALFGIALLGMLTLRKRQQA